MKPPVFRYDERHATDAYEVHQALVWLEARHPELRRNARWLLLRMDAYEDFQAAFTKEAA